MSERRSLGLFDITCLGLNCVIGSGIFLSPGEISAHLGSYAPLAFVLGGLLCLTIALCFAEMASLFGNTGGAYLYARAAFGERPGFMVGFAMWLSGVIGGATVAVGFADMLGCSGMRGTLAVTVLVLLLAGTNYCGAKLGAWTNNLLTTVKMLPLLALAGYAVWRFPVMELARPASTHAPEWGSLLLILYAFSGFEEIALPAGEVRRPERDVPLAIVLVILLSSAFYAVLQGLVGAEQLAGSAQPLQDASAAVPTLHTALVVAGVASLASINAAIAFTAPRSMWALAQGGWFPKALQALHPRFGSPYRCIVLNSLLTWALAVSGSFAHLVRMSVLISLVQYLATVLALLKLRRSERRAPVRVPLPVPWVALLVCLVLLGTSQWGDVLAMAAALAVGAVFAWVAAPRPVN